MSRGSGGSDVSCSPWMGCGEATSVGRRSPMRKPRRVGKQGTPVADGLRALVRLLAKLAARKMRSPEFSEGQSDTHVDPSRDKDNAH